MFVGRSQEVDRLDSHLIQTKAGKPTNFIITGERGIGKSSLLLYIKYVAQGDIPINSEPVRFLVISTDVDKSTTQLGLVKKVELAIRKTLAKTEPARQFLASAWEFIKRIEAAGVHINATQQDVPDELLLEEFAYTISEIEARVSTDDAASSVFNAHYDGILILIDEADNASPQLDLGTFLKLTLERLQRLGSSHVMIGLAALPELRGVLMESHPSSLRNFDKLVLDRLTPGEAAEVIDRCLNEANSENEEQTQITEEAKDTLATLSEGYPHFAQQFGFSAFNQDTDNVIDRDDVLNGAFGKGGALELIGDRYYRDDFYNKIQADSYRRVLRIMADNLDGWITKQEIRSRFKGKDSVLDNALKALRERHIILSKEGKPGVYRLQHKGFALWMKLHTSDQQDIGGSIQASASEEEHNGPPHESQETKPGA